MMETLKNEISNWVNKLDFTERKVIVQMYQNGVKVGTISTIYEVDRSSIYYHLKNAGVFIKNKKGEIDIKNVKKQNPGNNLDFYKKKDKVHATYYKYETHEDHEKNFPLSYKEYVQREINRNSILYKNGISDIKTKFSNSDHDSNVIERQRERNVAYSEKTRRGTKIKNTKPVQFDDSITKQNIERFNHNSESISQGKVSQFVSITF